MKKFPANTWAPNPEPVANMNTVTIFFDKYDGEIITRGSENMGSVESDVRYWLGKSPGTYIDEFERIFAVERSNQIDFTHCIQKFRDAQFESEERTRKAERLRQYEALKKEFEA